jgi:cholesterol oxidase
MTDTRLQWSKSIDHWMETFNTDAQQPVCDVLVIGSGYGGSFAARELAEPQNRVWVMERGREY